VTACPGACNAAWRATGEGEPRPGNPVWCPADAARINAKLAQLDDLAAEYEYQVTGFHEQARSPHRGGNAPSPSQAADDLDELDRMLTGWEDAYRDWHNIRHPERPWLTRPYRGVLATLRHGTVCWLSTNLAGILASDLAADFGAEVSLWHREFTAKTRAGTGRRLGVVPCPQCGLRLLAWADGYDGLVCGNCGRHVTRDEYDHDVHATARRLEHAQ
jgi:hypothetical protein